MDDQKDFYSPDEVAGLLDLHVRTVRRFILQGKLKAARIGKQYRIAAADLDEFVASNGPPRPAAPVPRHRRVLVSTTVDVDAISREDSDRLTTALIGAFNSLRGEGGGKRLECIYYEEQGRLRIVMNAELSLTNAVLGMIGSIVNAEGNDN